MNNCSGRYSHRTIGLRQRTLFYVRLNPSGSLLKSLRPSVCLSACIKQLKKLWTDIHKI